ncbi:hypothetical protein LUI11_15485 [Bradyrhizobium diazoefficiens]|uniref:Uncharacterized protein n=1 Tax=Bradyrhizobium diazoefficiens SEMIA 5080 TaxID=754504 RepID=A0A837CKX8_9BRAD|nr:hypothetical protein [Bradyrhizobium diazoefficiens]WAX24310.1 hypothetical protein [Bradyrhizobium phage ppBdUSDA122-1]APO53491.1 hypothetical protein BD122_24500 [Bradyrhizobium diazoefficiens]KGJ69984.1 hypothetical protein BJA5080_04251 [Bradyrhizobium diazoefficiens SEMIA 5080]KOY09326.1 hypothetical protein AF336_15240 [Bradyrhizobium diazoefficiens]MCD9294921.1 hypothetical protein [Bradyrhizobium diazoefficiens]
MNLTLRPIGDDDYSVLDDGQLVGRIRHASEHRSGIWAWTCIVHIPNPPAGTAQSLDAAKAAFKAAWSEFKSRQAPERLAKAYKAMNLRAEND